ncbi:hypothetical protein C7377_0289 [Balneicella halophila]|uniref:Uncharacterized protein n=1 Tax=Balneicella halophila TaxID=1537566 RepID=A0A7L4USM3_BALHA|nr:hypothetical protein [Balneicella halophila]PVX51994.1 hypothetical protein C7377_0289 [Balneicella halophila]
MALFTKQRKPRGLTRKPIYWDPEKEEREAREQRIKAELGITSDDKNSTGIYRPEIKGKFRSAHLGSRDEIKEVKRKSIRRTIIFFFILIALLYLMIAALPFLEQFLEKFV